MATRRRLRARITELEDRDERRLDRITELEKRVAAAGVGTVTPREVEMADRIISLERALKRTQQQLDDALGNGALVDAALDAAGAREAARRATTGGAA